MGNSFYHQPPVAARISHSGDDRAANKLTKKFRILADQLDRQARKLDGIHSAGKEGQAWGSGVSLVGGKQLVSSAINQSVSLTTNQLTN